MKRTWITTMALVALAVLAGGCGGDDDDVTLADFEGQWTGTSFVVTAQDDDEASVDVIALGATITFDTDDTGRAEGTFGLPAILGGPTELPIAADFELVDEESMTVTFETEVPPLLTSYTGPFELEGDTMTLTDEDTMFEFVPGEGAVPATAVAEFSRE